MSRVAKKILPLPKGVELKDADGVLSVKGPKGTLTMNIIDVTPIPHNGCRPPKKRRV